MNAKINPPKPPKINNKKTKAPLRGRRKNRYVNGPLGNQSFSTNQKRGKSLVTNYKIECFDLAQATKFKEIALRHKYLGHVCHCSNAHKKN